MFPKKANLYVAKMPGEWQLRVSFDDGPNWCIHSWFREPNSSQIAIAKEIAYNSFAAYHSSIKMEKYELEVID